MNMLTRTKVFLTIVIAQFGALCVNAQSIDYLRHKKTFFLCDYKLDCAGCYDCQMSKYTVTIKNVADKKITGVAYTYYSRTYNKVITKHATITGSVIDPKQIGKLSICLPNGKHWAITQINYDDNSNAKFVVKDRLDDFVQEPDECDCNPRTTLPNPNIN